MQTKAGKHLECFPAFGMRRRAVWFSVYSHIWRICEKTRENAQKMSVSRILAALFGSGGAASPGQDIFTKLTSLPFRRMLLFAARRLFGQARPAKHPRLLPGMISRQWWIFVSIFVQFYNEIYPALLYNEKKCSGWSFTTQLFPAVSMHGGSLP